MTSDPVPQDERHNVQQNRHVCGYPIEIVWPESSKSPDDLSFHIAADVDAWRYRIQNRNGKLLVWGPGYRESPVGTLAASEPDALTVAKRFAQADPDRRVRRMVVPE